MISVALWLMHGPQASSTCARRLYHVILRGNARQDNFFRAEDRPRKSE
jgi:hypothetical protein